MLVLLTLLSEVNCDCFSQIQDDKIALWQLIIGLIMDLKNLGITQGVKDGLG